MQYIMINSWKQSKLLSNSIKIQLFVMLKFTGTADWKIEKEKKKTMKKIKNQKNKLVSRIVS